MMCAHDAGTDAESGGPEPAERTLLLVRHATAGSPPATSDRDRPLSDHGRSEAAALGRWLAEQQQAGRWAPITTVLCSPARRTRETLRGLGTGVEALMVENLYGGGVTDVVQAIGAVPAGSGTVLVVGHAPGVPATALDLDEIVALSGSAPADRPALHRFPPSSLAVLRSTASWRDIGEQGAVLVEVRHP